MDRDNDTRRAGRALRLVGGGPGIALLTTRRLGDQPLAIPLGRWLNSRRSGVNGVAKGWNINLWRTAGALRSLALAMWDCRSRRHSRAAAAGSSASISMK